ncbi:hypothetical protein GCM10009845_06030 [Pedococcus bigeumensis]
MRGWQWHPVNRASAQCDHREPPDTEPCCDTGRSEEELIIMSEEAEKARQALQESMDLREQGHSDD